MHPPGEGPGEIAVVDSRIVQSAVARHCQRHRRRHRHQYHHRRRRRHHPGQPAPTTRDRADRGRSHHDLRSALVSLSVLISLSESKRNEITIRFNFSSRVRYRCSSCSRCSRRLVSLLSCSVRHSSRDSSSRVEFVCYLSSFVVSRAQAPREVRRQRATVTRARSVSPPTAAHSALELKRVVSSVLTRDAIRTSSGHPTG